MPLSIIIPALNEAEALPSLIDTLAQLDPKPREIILVDGGSRDETVSIARAAGFSVLVAGRAGRAAQMNEGALQANGDLFCFLHADMKLPVDFCDVASSVLVDKETILAGFFSLISGPRKTRWLSSLHNYIKSWYALALFKPITFFVRGGRLIFGDQVMICRREDFEAVGGFDASMRIMEEADFCLRLARAGRGRMRMINRRVWTSDRRISKWSGLTANLRFTYIALAWNFGASQDYLTRLYTDIR